MTIRLRGGKLGRERLFASLGFSGDSLLLLLRGDCRRRGCAASVLRFFVWIEPSAGLVASLALEQIKSGFGVGCLEAFRIALDKLLYGR